MFRRTMDAGFLNQVANDPEVRPYVGGAGEIDLTDALADPRNIALVSPHGGVLFVWLDAGLYELHTMMLPEGRGLMASAGADEVFRWMFTRTDCMDIVTKLPQPNKAAGVMSTRIGFSDRFVRDNAWEGGAAVRYRGLTFDEWRGQDGEVEAAGHAFHETLEAAKAAEGSTLPTHPDDPAHDRAAGAAVLMALAGNVGKGAWTYNRWAAFAGYASIEVLSVAPPVMNVRDAIVTAQDGRLEVLKCL